MFTSIMIEELRSSLVGAEHTEKWLSSDKADEVFKLVSSEFLVNNLLDLQFMDALNSIKDVQLEQTAVSKLSYKLPTFRCMLKHSKFKQVESNLVIAKTLIDGMKDLGHLKFTSDVVKEVSDSGDVKWVTRTDLFFSESEVKDLTFGASTVAGMLISKSVHVKTGGKEVKLGAKQKGFATDVSSMPLRLAKTPREWFVKYFKQSAWYVNALDKGIEDKILLDIRANSYIDAIMDLQAKETLYLSIWFDARYRLYYDLTLMGINPHGKLGETSQWELDEPRLLTNLDLDVMVDSVVKIATGKRMSHEDNWTAYKANSYEYLELLVDETKWDMDDLFYNTRLVQAIKDCDSNTPSYFMVAEDCTTGGLQHGGVGFRSVKSMEASNVGGNVDPHDAHTAIQEEFGLVSRNKAKDVNTPLLHGSSTKTIANVLEEQTGEKHSVKDIEEHLVHVYGPEVLNIPKIASWGTNAVCNDQPSLLFKTIDGWLAQSTSYMESVPNMVYALSISTKTGYSKSTIVRDMPLLLSRKGEPVYGKDTKVPGSSKGVRVKNRGLYANITHAIDGCALRDIARLAVSKGESMLFKHDDFMCTPSFMVEVREEYKASLVHEYETMSYHSALNDIVAHSITKGIKAPELVMGEGTVDMISESSGFMSA